QAEDGIRDRNVTGVQTCALPISLNLRFTNDIFAKNATFNYPLVTRPAAGDFIGQATVNTTGTVVISPGAQSATIWDGRNWGDARSEERRVGKECRRRGARDARRE